MVELIARSAASHSNSAKVATPVPSSTSPAIGTEQLGWHHLFRLQLAFRTEALYMTAINDDSPAAALRAAVKCQPLMFIPV